MQHWGFDTDFVKTFPNYEAFEAWSNGRHDPEGLKSVWESTHAEQAHADVTPEPDKEIIVPEPEEKGHGSDEE